MAKAPALRLQPAEGSTHRVLRARANAAAPSEAQPSARVLHKGDRDERERAGQRGRADTDGDNRQRTNRDCRGAAGSGSTQPSILLAARKGSGPWGRTSHAQRTNSVLLHSSRDLGSPIDRAVWVRQAHFRRSWSQLDLGCTLRAAWPQTPYGHTS